MVANGEPAAAGRTHRGLRRRRTGHSPQRERASAARALGNRPIRFDEHGRLDQAIVDVYDATGFYIFEGVLGAEELTTSSGTWPTCRAAPVTKGLLSIATGVPHWHRQRRQQPQLDQAARPDRRHSAPTGASRR
jgi:hypothetical protein